MVEKIDIAIILFATFSLGSSFASLAYDITRPQRALTLSNVGEGDYTREVRMPLFDLLLCNESGVPVGKWSDSRNLIKAMLRIHIAPGESFNETKIWDFKE
ncbi:MAG: hypothetical protein JSV27_09605 [Candidatus Bathyarchaeota archaeon]|nr:MAG: hypothetical protein JSV27_09605 [Candidatus Bathyarchaeota archaeon]